MMTNHFILLKYFIICLLATRLDSLRIQRNSGNGDTISDLTSGEDIKFCGIVTSNCACNDNEAFFDQYPAQCQQTLSDSILRTRLEDGTLEALYTIPLITLEQNYTINVTKADGSEVCLQTNNQSPIFLRDYVAERMQWNPLWTNELKDRIQLVKKGEYVEITFNKYWSGLLLRICFACDQSCVAVKFQGDQTYPLISNNVISVLGTAFPITTTTTTTVTTTTTTSTTTTTTTSTTTTPTTTPSTTTTASTIASTTTTPTARIATTTTKPATTTITVTPNTGALGDDSNEETFIIIGVIIAFFFIILIILAICCYIGRKRKNVDMMKNSTTGVTAHHEYVRHLNSEEGLSSSPRELNTRIKKTFYDKISVIQNPKVPKSSKKKNTPSNTETGISNQAYEDLEAQSTYEIPNEKQNPVFEGPSNKGSPFHFTPYYSKNKSTDSPEYATVIRKNDDGSFEVDDGSERVDII